MFTLTFFILLFSFLIQTLYFSIALLNDFVGSNEVLTTKDRPVIRKIRDYVYGTFVFPLAFDVGGMFWLLYAIDRELVSVVIASVLYYDISISTQVFPLLIDAFFPWFLNQMIHTNIIALCLIEMLLLHHKYPCRKSAFVGIGALMFGYLTWIHVVWIKAGVWVIRNNHSNGFIRSLMNFSI